MPLAKNDSARDEVREFRQAIERATDWIIRYFEHPEDYPVLSMVNPGEVAGAFSGEAPESGRPYGEILDDFETKILPGITHWNHPRFFAYFAISGSFPGILGEYLCAALNVNGMLWKTSPALTELEEISLGHLRCMLGIGSDFFGVILDTASTSSLIAIAAARESIHDFSIKERGMTGRRDLPRLTLYASQEAHSSIEKAAIVLGIGLGNVRKIRVDEAYQMDPQDLEKSIVRDIKRGYHPFCVVATVGTTSTTSVDPVPAISKICHRFDLWLHVDAAYAGIAAILPEKRETLSGCENADSIVVNPHKWLFTPIDLSAFYCKRPSELRSAFSLVPEYLRGEKTEATNLMDYGFQLGRRFRALKLWMVMNYYGRKGLQAIIKEHIRLAGYFKDWVEKSPLFELSAPVPFSTVCFRLNPGPSQDSRAKKRSESREAFLNRLNERLLDHVNRSGKAFLSHTKLGERFVLRCAIGNMRTTQEHVDNLCKLLDETANELIEAEA